MSESFEPNLYGQARNLLIWLASSTHSAYHNPVSKGRDWHQCDQEFCKRVATWLEETDVPEGAEHEIVTSVNVQSILGLNSGQGLVVIQMGGAIVHVEPDNAREVAMNIIRGAEAAESDETLVVMLKSIGLGRDQCASMLHNFREARKFVWEGKKRLASDTHAE